jgi:hypothetical protein
MSEQDYTTVLESAVLGCHAEAAGGLEIGQHQEEHDSQQRNSRSTEEKV